MFRSDPFRFWFLVVLAVLATTILVGLVAEAAAMIKQRRQKSRGSQMIKKAQNYRRRFVTNSDHDIIGICTSAAFTLGLYAHNQKVESGETKEWEKVVVYAKPIFTFAGSEQTRRPIHTGVKANLNTIVGSIVMALTGVDPDKVSCRDYEKALQIIFERDSRLFVPYAGSPSEGEKQFAFYGKTDIKQADNYLNRSIGR